MDIRPSTLYVTSLWLSRALLQPSERNAGTVRAIAIATLVSSGVALGVAGCPAGGGDTETDTAATDGTSAGTGASASSTETSGGPNGTSEPTSNTNTDANTSTSTDATMSGSDTNTDSDTNTSTDSGTDTNTNTDSDSDSDSGGEDCVVDPDADPGCGDGIAALDEFCPGDPVLSPNYLGSRGRVADINNDGALDVVGRYNTLINDGAATLYETVHTPVLQNRNLRDGDMIAVGDFTGDGNADFVFINKDDELRQYNGNGYGAFDNTNLNGDGSWTSNMTVADFNQDGLDDVIVRDNMWYGVQDGDLSGPFDLGVNGGIRALASADIDGNGRVDFVTGTGTGFFVYMSKDMGPGFEDPIQLVNAPAFVDCELADIDGDGELDVVGAHSVQENISVLLGDGDGNFTVDPLLEHTIDYLAIEVEIYDFNGDGLPDISYSGDTNGVGLLLGEDSPDLFAPELLAFNGTTSIIKAADLDGDGFDDLVAAEGDGLDIYWGNPEADFDVTTNQIAVGNTVSTLAIADINNDGHPDAIVGCTGDVDCRSVFVGNAEGWLASTAVDYPWSVRAYPVVRDFNYDGYMDYAMAQDGGIGMYMGNGAGGSSPEVFYPSTGTDVLGLEAGDFNGDDVDDLVMLTEERTPEVFASLGDGQIAAAGQVIQHNYGAPISGDLTVGDFDGDDKPDVVAVYSSVAELRWYRGLGGYNLVNDPEPVPITAAATRVENADLDGDGDLDLVLVMRDVDRIATLFGNGDGTFGGEALYAAECPYPNAVDLTDIDRDGDPDIAGNCSGTAAIQLLNDGSGVMSPGHTYELMADGGEVFVADFNNDCGLDVFFGYHSNQPTAAVFVGDP